jgi:rod shape-determining protein MreC
VQQLYLPDFFWKYRRPITLLLFLGLLCLVMLDSIHRKWVARAGSELMLGLSFPVQKLSESAYDGGRASISNFFYTRAENIALRKRVGELEQEMVALKEQVSENRRLDELSGFVNDIESPKLIARVIGTNPTTWFRAVMIDKGRTGGVQRFFPALSSSGLAGFVIEVSRSSSKVLLLTDANSKVSVIVQRSRSRGVVQGNNAGGCVLKYVEPTADIKKGDLLVTSGTSRIYPPGLPVGTIDELKNKPGSLFQWADVIPATDFGRLEEVALILTARMPDAGMEPEAIKK